MDFSANPVYNLRDQLKNPFSRCNVYIAFCDDQLNNSICQPHCQCFLY